MYVTYKVCDVFKRAPHSPSTKLFKFVNIEINNFQILLIDVTIYPQQTPCIVF